jgi:uncharacterized membrane protein YdfJ with MMPL/SSD domain
MFDRWGRFVYRWRWPTLIVSALLLGLSVAGILTGGTLAGNGGFGANLAAGQAAKLISQELNTPQQQVPTGSSIELIFSSHTLSATDQEFKAAVQQAVTPLVGDLRVTAVDTPYNVLAGAQSSYISKDSHQALVVVHLRDSSLKAQGYVNEILNEVHP